MNTPATTSTVICAAALAALPTGSNPNDLFAKYYLQDIYQRPVAYSPLVPCSIFNRRDNILADIKSLPNEYGKANWDGYDANAVINHSIESASRFVYNLPETIEEPDVSCDADGFVCLEWYHDSANQCLITFSDDDQIFCNLVSHAERTDKTYASHDTPAVCNNILKVANV